ncbi:MAG TPA: DUF2339 domain-containing protein [Noviherbaspirillum sp.]|nr:DUF2339 domain-containing protein [Noviherbaspirillum sp.]
MALLFFLIAAVIYFVLVGKINRLQKRVARLEEKLEWQQQVVVVGDARKGAKAGASPATREAAAEVVAGATAESQDSRSATPAPEPDADEILRKQEASKSINETRRVRAEPISSEIEANTALSTWEQTTASVFELIKKNPFATAGVLMMLIGAGFLFALLAANNILPPAVRVLSVAAVGVAVFVIGLRQAPSRTFLGLNLQGGALALEYLCTLWAYQGYQLIGTTEAFILLAGLSTLAFGWSLRTERVLFAFIGLAGALLTPVVASTNEGSFAALTLYATWVSLLSAGVGVRLHAPSLASAALAGTSVLLGAALDLPAGTHFYTIVAAIGMALAYNAAAILWAHRQEHLAGLQRASIVSVLAAASLVMAGFMYTKANVSSDWCAAMLGLTALAQLLAMRSALPEWKGWLLGIGGGLSLIAIGVGLDGASRAMALSASALGFILTAHALDKERADIGAALYWLVSVLAAYGAWDSGQAGTLPLAVAALVALGAGFVNRPRRIGWFYAATAPIVLCVAILRHDADEPTSVLAWFLAWAISATLAGRQLRWLQLRTSALWLLPAGLLLFVAPFGDTNMAGWNLREMLLIGWLVGSAILMRLYNRDPETPYRLNQEMLGLATLLVPVLANIELARAFDAMAFRDQTTLAASILLWAGWCAVARTIAYITRFDWQWGPAGMFASLLTACGIVVAPPELLTELSQWGSVVLLAVVSWKSPETKRIPGRLLWGLAGAVLTGTLLRAIGSRYGLEEGALVLLFERVMQPWISVMWAAGGVAVVVVASKRHMREMWMGGGIALAVLVAKMLLVDLSALTLTAKVTVFLLVGLGFLGLGYFCPLPPERSEEER